MILKDEEAAERPTSFLGFWVLREETEVIVASGGGKVENRGLVFYFPTVAKLGCGNVGISRCLRDFQGAVERVEKLLLLFHPFHGPGSSTAFFRVPGAGRFQLRGGRGDSILTRRKSWALAAAIFWAHSVSLIFCATWSNCAKLSWGFTCCWASSKLFNFS